MSPRASERLLLDTHIWYWYVAGSQDLPASLREVIDGALGSCWLSPISLWELSMLADKKRLRLEPGVGPWVRRALAGFPVHEAPLSFDVALRVEMLHFKHGDPADHLLAATAVVYGLTLVTVDRNLVEASWLDTLTA